MTVRNPLLAWPALAAAGLLLSAGDAPAFFFHHHGGVYKQRTVIRGGHGGAPVVYGAPAARVGPVTRTEFFPLAPTFGTEFYRLGAAEFYPLTTAGAEFYPLGGLRSAQESALLDAFRAESGRLSSKGSPGGPTAPAPAAGCPELAGRLDKVEARLGALETRLTGIEAKVDALVAERKDRGRAEEQARLVEQIVTAVNNQQNQVRLENNRALVGLIEELAKPVAERNKERVDALRKALTGQ